MPPRPRQPGPTIYLDTSTLSNAFSSHDLTLTAPGRPDAAFQALLPWIGRVAVEANLCVSVFHLKELACWGDHARRIPHFARCAPHASIACLIGRPGGEHAVLVRRRPRRTARLE